MAPMLCISIKFPGDALAALRISRAKPLTAPNAWESARNSLVASGEPPVQRSD